MLDADRINAMLAWDDLPSPQKLLLACALRKLGGTPDVALVTKLTESRTPEVAVLATALLLDLGSADPAAAGSALPRSSRSAVASTATSGVRDSVSFVTSATSGVPPSLRSAHASNSFCGEGRSSHASIALMRSASSMPRPRHA